MCVDRPAHVGLIQNNLIVFFPPAIFILYSVPTLLCESASCMGPIRCICPSMRDVCEGRSLQRDGLRNGVDCSVKQKYYTAA